MADEKPQAVTLEGPVEVRITNELLPFLQTLMDPQGNPVVAAGGGGGSTLSDIEVKGQTPSGDKHIVRLDEQYLLRTRPFEPYQEIVVTDIGVAWTVVAENAVANSINRVWVEIWKYHTGTQPEGVDIRFDDGGATHEIVHNLFVTAQAPAPKFGPYHLTNGWSIDMQTNVAARCRCVATIEHYGMDAL